MLTSHDELLVHFFFVGLINIMLHIEAELFVPKLVIVWTSPSSIIPLVYLKVIPYIFQMLQWIFRFRTFSLRWVQIFITHRQTLVRYVFLYPRLITSTSTASTLLAYYLFKSLLWRTNASGWLFTFIESIFVLIFPWSWSWIPILLLIDATT